MSNIIEYVKGSYDEFVHKVTWSSWNELQSSTLTVAVFAIVLALVASSFDYLFNNLLIHLLFK